MSVYDEMMRCDTELRTTIVVTAMATNGGHKFNLSGLRWNSNDASVIFFVVVLVKLATSE